MALLYSLGHALKAVSTRGKAEEVIRLCRLRKVVSKAKTRQFYILLEQRHQFSYKNNKHRIIVFF